MAAVTSRRRDPLLPETERLYVGIGDSVVALDPATGEEIWRTKLQRMSSFVTVAFLHGRIYAATGGEIYCLDPVTGEVVWHNKMKGLGMGYVTFAGEEAATQVVTQAALRQSQAATGV